MGMMLRLLRRVVGVITYPYVLSSLHNDKFERPNGNLSPNAPWVHSTITSSYNKILDGKVVGPASSYAVDIVDIRIPNKSGYIRARITTSRAAMNNGGNTRLNFKSGKSYASTSQPTNTFQSAALRINSAEINRLGLSGQTFQRGWALVPNWGSAYLAAANQYKPNDEVAIMWFGRRVTAFYNGEAFDFELTDEQWTPGYFAGIALDTDHSLEEVEIGYLGPLNWREYGDSFKSPNLDNLWNLSTTKNVHIADGVQADPVSATTNGLFFAGGILKQQMHEADQIIRGTLKPPTGVTAGNTLGAMLLGRCGSTIIDATPFVMLYVTPAGGIAIYTVLSGAMTVRHSASLGALSYPIDIELQCIGNRYFGLVNGQPATEWQDTTGVVPITEERRGWGWQTSVNRASSTYTYGPAIELVYACGNVNIPIGSPEIFGLGSSTVPLAGASSFVVHGTNFHSGTRVFLDGTLCETVERWSTNEIEVVLPAKPEGVYDISVTSPNGDALLIDAVEYVSLVPYGKYEPTTTPLTAGSTWIKIPLNAADPATTSATVNGVITGLPKGYYQLRAIYTTPGWRSDVRYKPLIPAGELATYIGPGSSGTVDNSHLFSVADNGSLEIQFYRSGAGAQTVDTANYDFELILLSATKLPAWLAKNGTQLLGTVANVYEKITGWTLPIDYNGTTVATGDEILVPADGDYTLEWQVSFSTAAAANVGRVTNQFGTVLASKTTASSMGTQVVSLKKNDSLKLEAMTTNVSTAGRRTVTAATLFRIIPVI